MVVWRDNGPWPYVHYCMPMALYVFTRDLFSSLFLIYLWETFELVVKSGWPALGGEGIWGQLVTDPIIGALAIFTAWLADEVWNWKEPFLMSVPLWSRLLFFLINGASSAIFVKYETAWATLVFGTIYIVSALLLLGLYASPAAITSVYALVGLIGVQTLVTAPRSENFDFVISNFTRAFTVGGVALFIVLVSAALLL